MGRDDIKTRAQPEVKGVAQDDFGTTVGDFLGRERLDRAIGPNWHERRRFDLAMCQRHASTSRRAALPQELELHARTPTAGVIHIASP